MASHRCNIYRTLEEFLASRIDTDAAQRRGRRIWRQHVEKNGNVPMIVRCLVCSDTDYKKALKAGKVRPRRPNKSERDELKGKDS